MQVGHAQFLEKGDFFTQSVQVPGKPVGINDVADHLIGTVPAGSVFTLGIEPFQFDRPLHPHAGGGDKNGFEMIKEVIMTAVELVQQLEEWLEMLFHPCGENLPLRLGHLRKPLPQSGQDPLEGGSALAGDPFWWFSGHWEITDGCVVNGLCRGRQSFWNDLGRTGNAEDRQVCRRRLVARKSKRASVSAAPPWRGNDCLPPPRGLRR